MEDPILHGKRELINVSCVVAVSGGVQQPTLNPREERDTGGTPASNWWDTSSQFAHKNQILLICAISGRSEQGGRKVIFRRQS